MTFLLGLIVFFGAHLWTAFARGPRQAVIAKIGAGPYKGLYSLVSLAGLALIVAGWGGAAATPLYVPPDWMRSLTFLLTFAAMIALAAANLPKGRIAATLKHPMLVGVKLWALGHLLSNGEARSVILFGAFLAYAVVDRIAVKARGETGPAPGPLRHDVVAVLVGAAAWAAIYAALHPFIGGVALR